MRRLTIITSALLLVLSACSKMASLSSEPFSIEIYNLQSKAAWIDIVPETNDFGYYYSVISVKEFDYKYSSNYNLMMATDAMLREMWEEYFTDVMPFRDFAMYSGSFLEPVYELEPETEYYAFAYPYDDKDRPVDKVVKLRFCTKPYKESDIKFTVSLDGSMLSVTPTNSDSYYWEWEETAIIEDDYWCPLYFYEACLRMYEEYGFMDTVLSRGKDGEDMAPYYDALNPGDEIYLVAAGYTDGTNSPVYAFRVTYAGEGLPGKVEEVDAELRRGSSTLSSRISRGRILRPSGLGAPQREPLSVHKASSQTHFHPLCSSGSN